MPPGPSSAISLLEAVAAEFHRCGHGGRLRTKDSQKGGKSAEETPRRGGRPVLRVSHGSKSSDARPAPPRVGLSTPSTPAKPSAPIAKPPKRKRPTAERHSSETVHSALAVAKAALDKKASNLEIIDLVGKADYADYLVLMSGGSERHVRALADEIQDQLRKRKVRPLSVEGLTACTWVLLDFGDVVVHVFQESARSLYDLDGLWLDAARVPVPDEAPPSGS